MALRAFGAAILQRGAASLAGVAQVPAHQLRRVGADQVLQLRVGVDKIAVAGHRVRRYCSSDAKSMARSVFWSLVRVNPDSGMGVVNADRWASVRCGFSNSRSRLVHGLR